MSREVKDERSVVVVSDLDPEPDENEILENFEKYGCLDKVLIAKHRPWVALVYFDDKRVAREAARCLDGTRMSGSRVTVELASGITIRSKCESSKVYMYDLGNGATKREICEIFKVFGRLKHVWAENQRDEYVVIVYEKAHQARDAVRNLDGTLINGKPVRVKLASERDTRVSQSSEEVYVGNLGSATDVREIEDTFMPFGALRRVWVSRNPEGCALVWFKDERDAREAVWCLDRRWLNDRQISVKLTKSWSHWCCWMPKNEGNSSNNSKHSTIAGNCNTLPRTFKVSYGFDCIYTQSYKDDQLHANSMKSTVADDKRYHSKTSKSIPIASIDSIDDWDGNKVNETVPDEVCVRNDDTVRREGSAQKRKSVEIEDDKARLQLEKTSKVNQLARLLEYRPKDVGDDGDASEMQSSDVAGSVNCANDGSVDKKAKSLKAKVKVKSTTVETAGDKKRKLEKKKRKKSKNENHSPDGRSKSSTPSYEYKFVENDYKVNNNTSNISSSNNNNSNINYSNSTYETGEFPAPENKSAQTEFNVNNLNNNGSTKNNNNNNSNNNINNSDNTCETVVFPALENESAQTDFNLNNVNGINSNDNIDDDNLNNSNNNINKDCDNPYDTVEFPAPEDCPPVMVEIVPRPTEESQNNPPNEERFSEGISDVEMRNAEVVATVNDSPEDDAMAMTSMTMTSLPLTSSSSSSADPTTLTGLPLVRVDKRSADGTPTGVCPQPSTIYIIHHHHHHYHYHHYHYHHRNQHRLAGDGDLVASTESDQ